MKTAVSPHLTILFIIDGMACGTLERLDLPMLHDIRDNGVYFPDLALPLPAHLERNDDVGSERYYPWGCSLPNVILQTGSLFIGASGLKENMIQHSFPEGTTAFVVNDDAYDELRYGYTYYVRYGHEEKDQYDYSGVLQTAQHIIAQRDLRFIRIHLQGPGSAGYLDMLAGRGLWSDQSMYRCEMVRADSALADFIAWLQKTGRYNHAALIVMGDHGQNDEGWHAPYVGQAHNQPVLFCGCGIKKGKIILGGSSLDIAPTICYMNEVDLPLQNMGRILHQVFAGKTEGEIGTSRIEQLNNALLQHHQLMERIPASQQSPEFVKVNEKFSTIECIGNWHNRFAGLEELVRHEERILHELQSLVPQTCH
jgi:hypothetical protein